MPACGTMSRERHCPPFASRGGQNGQERHPPTAARGCVRCVTHTAHPRSIPSSSLSVSHALISRPWRAGTAADWQEPYKMHNVALFRCADVALWAPKPPALPYHARIAACTRLSAPAGQRRSARACDAVRHARRARSRAVVCVLPRAGRACAFPLHCRRRAPQRRGVRLDRAARAAAALLPKRRSSACRSGGRAVCVAAAAGCWSAATAAPAAQPCLRGAARLGRGVVRACALCWPAFLVCACGRSVALGLGL
jgi:hypothetical protein